MTTRKFYEEELCELKQSLTSMCLAVERMIEDSIKALVEQDGELARSVVARDKRVDETELDIEKRCMRLLLIEQPVARDFREVSTALKLITDIERIGDQAADIAEIVSILRMKRISKGSRTLSGWAGLQSGWCTTELRPLSTATKRWRTKRLHATTRWTRCF